MKTRVKTHYSNLPAFNPICDTKNCHSSRFSFSFYSPPTLIYISLSFQHLHRISIFSLILTIFVSVFYSTRSSASPTNPSLVAIFQISLTFLITCSRGRSDLPTIAERHTTSVRPLLPILRPLQYHICT